MIGSDGVSRRRLLGLTGAALLAGCSGRASIGGEPDDDWEFLEEEPDYSGWLEDTPSYHGTVDWTGRDRVTVRVGTGGHGYQYSPAAARIDVGTTVVWEWTGSGGSHDVVENGGAFESEPYTTEGSTFEQTFTERGIYTYYCTPHLEVEMKGALEVV